MRCFAAGLVVFEHRDGIRPGHHLRLPAGLIDFGQTAQGQLLDASFAIENRGTELLTLLETRGECGCTTVRADGMTLAPGQRESVHVVFNTAGYHGDVSKQVYIISDDDAQPFQAVRFHTFVHFKAALDRSEVTLDPMASGGTADRVDLVISEDAARPDAAAPMVDGVADDMTLSFGPWTRADRVEACTARITVRPSAPVGWYERKLVVHVGAEELPLRVSYAIKPCVGAQPAAALVMLSGGNVTAAHVALVGPGFRDAKLSTEQNKAEVRLGADSAGSPELLMSARPGQVSPQGDYDTIKLAYTLEERGRQEELSIPVRFVATP